MSKTRVTPKIPFLHQIQKAPDSLGTKNCPLWTPHEEIDVETLSVEPDDHSPHHVLTWIFHAVRKWPDLHMKKELLFSMVDRIETFQRYPKRMLRMHCLYQLAKTAFQMEEYDSALNLIDTLILPSFGNNIEALQLKMNVLLSLPHQNEHEIQSVLASLLWLQPENKDILQLSENIFQYFPDFENDMDTLYPPLWANEQLEQYQSTRCFAFPNTQKKCTLNSYFLLLMNIAPVWNLDKKDVHASVRLGAREKSIYAVSYAYSGEWLEVANNADQEEVLSEKIYHLFASHSGILNKQPMTEKILLELAHMNSQLFFLSKDHLPLGTEIDNDLSTNVPSRFLSIVLDAIQKHAFGTNMVPWKIVPFQGKINPGNYPFVIVDFTPFAHIAETPESLFLACGKDYIPTVLIEAVPAHLSAYTLCEMDGTYTYAIRDYEYSAEIHPPESNRNLLDAWTSIMTRPRYRNRENVPDRFFQPWFILYEPRPRPVHLV
jgi:hypothetical protein